MSGRAIRDSGVYLVQNAGCVAIKQRLLRNQQVMQVLEQTSVSLKMDPNYLTALCAFETGWLNSSSQQLMNLFGISHNEVPERFASYQACARAWAGYFGAYVTTAGSPRDFVEGLRKARYNSVNPNYYLIVTKLIIAMPQTKKDCGVIP
jgi:drug/metabolite transporter superfamily protein YnfA